MPSNQIERIKGLLQKTSDDRFEFVASDETVDRQGESIPADSWDLTNFKKSPRLLADHEYTIDAILGVCENVRVEGGRLLFTPKFHEITERARTAAKMVAEGVLNTVSVGFMRKSDKKGNVTNELMEISLVAVPANPAAIMLGAKGMGDIASFLKEYEAPENAEPAEPTEPTEPAAEPPAEGAEPVAGEPEPEPKPEPDADQDETKGMTEEIIEASRALREMKWKYSDQMWGAFDKFCVAFFSDSVKTEDVKTLADELAAKIAEIGSMTPDQLPGTPMWCGFEGASKTAAEFSAKIGRVLSTKNRDTIKSQIDSLKSVIDALQELHDATQPEGGDDEEKSKSNTQRSNGSGTPTLDAYKLFDQLKQYNTGREVIRAINVATSEALRGYNKRDKK